MVPSLQPLLEKLHAVAVRMASLILPFVYIDTEALANANFLENATLMVLELVAAIRAYEEKQVVLRRVVDRCVVAPRTDEPGVAAEHTHDTDSIGSDIDMDDLVLVAAVPLPSMAPTSATSPRTSPTAPPTAVSPVASSSPLSATPGTPPPVSAPAAPRQPSASPPPPSVTGTPLVPIAESPSRDRVTSAAVLDGDGPDAAPLDAHAELQVGAGGGAGEGTAPASAATGVNGYDVAACGEVLHTLATMHVQLGTVLATLGNTIDATHTACAARGTRTHFSDDFSAALVGIIAAVDEAETVQEKRIDTSGLSKVRAVQYLQDNLARKQTKQSIALLRVFRKAWPHNVFGRSDDDNLDVLATMYAPVLVDGASSAHACVCARARGVYVACM